MGILAARLLRAEDEGRPLTAQERSHAAVMIEQSDNGAATALWQTIGGAAGLDAAHQRLGLTATRAGSGGNWGVTMTTAVSQHARIPTTSARRARADGAAGDVASARADSREQRAESRGHP
ncbi:serine hydrolase [Streptomyces violaceusniger]|uniref:serine hydrolase n=1 Tax=Streptomyces violaceusniger TaxID=68280 RepID=UPI0001E4DE10